MRFAKRITGLICAMTLLLGGMQTVHSYYEYSDYTNNYSGNVPYKYTYPDAPYKYTYPDAPYKYTYPDAPYKYTYPDSPYKYTYPDTPYRYTYPDTPYRYTYPDTPYRFTYPDTPYRYTHPEAPYKFTIPDTPYKYTYPDTPYKYTNLSGETVYTKNEYDNEYEEDEVLYSKPYWDIEGHPAEEYIIMLHELDVVEGYDDGSFRPDNYVTRAEMVKLVMKAAQIEVLPEEYQVDLYFADLDDWQAPYVNASYSLQIAEGYYDAERDMRVFLPNNYVNRAEGVKLVLASGGIQPGEIKTSTYTDVEGWMVPWIEVAYSIGIVEMPDDMRFYPAAPMTRGMAAMMIGRMIEFQS